jgi:hypothetical protein
MSKRLVNREELGKLIAQTSGAILMITESNYKVRSTSGNNTYTVTLLNQDGFVHAQIMRATMPSASMYMQLNFIIVKARHLCLLEQADRRTTHFSHYR